MAKRNSSQAGHDVSGQIHQIMEQLEEKTDLLFRLRKERQSIIEAECRLLPTMGQHQHQFPANSKYY